MAHLLEIMNYALLLIFGSIISFSFAGYEKTAKNRKAIALIVLMILSLQLTSYYFAGLSATERLYPLITHFPSVLFIERYLKRPRSIAIVSVLTAYLCCQPPNWLGLAMSYYWNSSIAYFIGDSLGIIIHVLPHQKICGFFRQPGDVVFRSIALSFGSFPIIYYIFV